MPDIDLTSPQFRRRLEGLVLLAKRVLAGSLQARRPTAQRGAGIVFAEHAEYHPGDDHRAIDWRVLARREELVVRLFERDEEASLYLLLDTSISMRHKALLSRQLAAALGYLALAGLDRVHCYAFSQRIDSGFGPAHGRGRAPALLHFLMNEGEHAGSPDFAGVVRAFQARKPKRGIVVVISDFFWSEGFAAGLRLLRATGHDTFVMQVLAESDQHIDQRGDVELHCVESGLRRIITIDPSAAARYQQLLSDWNRDLEQLCAEQGIGHLRCDTTQSFDQIIQSLIERGGLV
jgi:uncharacterized protein (DUF58 family)